MKVDVFRVRGLPFFSRAGVYEDFWEGTKNFGKFWGGTKNFREIWGVRNFSENFWGVRKTFENFGGVRKIFRYASYTFFSLISINFLQLW